jgi:hypothetical protein
MRKVFMTVVAVLVLMGTTVTTKAVSLLKSSEVSINQNENSNFVLKHASELFGNNALSMTAHGSHSSHASHASHASHSSHYSSR